MTCIGPSAKRVAAPGSQRQNGGLREFGHSGRSDISQATTAARDKLCLGRWVGVVSNSTISSRTWLDTIVPAVRTRLSVCHMALRFISRKSPRRQPTQLLESTDRRHPCQRWRSSSSLLKGSHSTALRRIRRNGHLITHRPAVRQSILWVSAQGVALDGVGDDSESVRPPED